MNTILSRTIIIENRLGLHARAAAKLVRLTTTFNSSVTLVYGDKAVNAKSILGLLMLAAPMGSQVEIQVEGPDAELALEKVEALFHNRFEEE
ncbi:HPr family phosphocarrier protein [Desulfurispira natronophila]|uniref:Phosphotransferase system HPr (HPr) family protein n=1 Tax=Desulfurispira natronophila TaxID=682562 RepID=A0A7W7Y624_9BACT|nr:HPr family phosphocarrier protein [Desulfurispira natronophila]MBB5022775.1 phosphotransferase system HPr (HPr) family protein [Desulfurispira natronophila]